MLNILTTGGSAIVNVIALVFVLGFALYGLMRGFAKTFITMFSTILSILFAILLCSAVAGFLESKYSLVSSLSGSLTGVVGKMFGQKAMELPLSLATEETMKTAGVNRILSGFILSVKENGAYQSNTTLGQAVCPTLAYYIILIISAIALFIVFELIFIVIGKIIAKSYKIKLVKRTDKASGFVLGLVAGIIYFETIVMVIGAIPLGATQNLFVLIENSAIARVICAINPYDSIFSLVSFRSVFNFVSSII